MKYFIYVLIILFPNYTTARQYGFENISASAGVQDYGKNYGVAIGDFDNDGDEDVYISRTGDQANLLYVNHGDWKFVEQASKAGIAYEGTTYHSIWGDVDNDGDLDLYLGNKNQANVLYLNNGDGTFQDITTTAGVGNTGGAVSAIFGDVDNDGWIDIYVANINAQNVLYRNNGDNTFSDITSQSGATDELIAMGTMFIDYDNDNDLDLYLSHDALQANILYENDGTGKFSNVAQTVGVDYEGFGMGTEFADFNNDGHYDIYITNLYDNTLYINNQNGTFVDQSVNAGVNDYGMGWGVSCLDYNNDGLQDIYAVNNSYFSPYPNVLYENLGNGEFTEVGAGTSLESNYAGYGVGCADFDGDGWLDIFVANSGSTGGNQLFRNIGGEGNWVTFKLMGTVSNAAGIGTKVSIKTSNTIQSDQVTGGAGYASQNSMVLHFGLGDQSVIDEVAIIWPSGIREVYNDIQINQHYLVTEDQSIEVVETSQTITSATDFALTESITIYPNPATTIINIEMPDQLDITGIEIFDISGKLIKKADVVSKISDSHMQYPLPKSLNNGSYIIKIFSRDLTFVKRIEVAK